ncbi:hypothetical protein BDW69DRAFT_154362 [Aspergillus filifer]
MSRSHYRCLTGRSATPSTAPVPESTRPRPSPVECPGESDRSDSARLNQADRSLTSSFSETLSSERP